VKRAFYGLVWGGIFLLASSAAAQTRNDPLTQTEIDQLRDTAQEPDKRLELYVKFARERLEAVDKARADLKAADPGQEIHDRLQDFLDIYDELDDNVETYSERKDDIRKVLGKIIAANTEFEAKLRALKDSASISKDETQKYDFVLQSAIQAIDDNTPDYKQLLADQEEAAKHKRLVKQ